MGSRARDDEKFTDEEIFTARIVKEGIVLAAEECFKRVLPRQRDTQTGFKRILPRQRDTRMGFKRVLPRQRHTWTGFKWIPPRQRDTWTGFKRILQVRETHGWVSHRPRGYGDSAQLRNASSQDHIPNFQAGRNTPYRH